MKVRLKHSEGGVASALVSFQFHEGPIKTHCQFDQSLQHYSFNSMKVRLKRANVIGAANAVMRFQFHEGPIKT